MNVFHFCPDWVGKYLLVLMFYCKLTSHLLAQGTVYLVLGSDTAIWEGMDVGRFHCTYNLGLYTDPSRNAFAVMDATFRNQLVDSYGQPVKFTWWMMAGNIFRYATNHNVPLPNMMTMYLMKKYHGSPISIYGDELSLHYHTFVWTDYDGDGRTWWNQAKSFVESRDDFNVTLAQLLLEEEVFPVSFRSGWHYMDNEWQHCLDSLLPYSMHNDWPAKRSSVTEPIDNVYDWSQAPSTFVPFHPSRSNYQLPGDGPGWNVRSKHIGAVDSTLMDYIFSEADKGRDQVACLWGHLPESDFLTNVQKINSLAHQADARYPGVTFRYCTAVEAMQRWRQSLDRTSPTLTIEELPQGDNLTFRITVNEPIFQSVPVVTVKDITERFTLLSSYESGPLQWTTSPIGPAATIAKVGIAVTDTMGNLSWKILRYLPDDVYVDNEDSGYLELRGAWSTVAGTTWGTDYRKAGIPANDSVKVSWQVIPGQTGYYNVYTQLPPVDVPPNRTEFRILQLRDTLATKVLEQGLRVNGWVHIGTVRAQQSSPMRVELVAYSAAESGSEVAVDVVKFSSLVRERDLALSPDVIDLHDVSIADTLDTDLQVSNRGTGVLTVQDMISSGGILWTNVQLPFTLQPAESKEIPLLFLCQTVGSVRDTLFVASDDPLRPVIEIPVIAEAHLYYRIVDNEDSTYQEWGSWYNSNAQAYGTTSRYAYIGGTPAPYARFNCELARGGVYDLQMIVPKTQNATTRALYEVTSVHTAVDSAIVDQNENSGSWVTVVGCTLPAGSVSVTVRDAGGGDATHPVLRADAVRFIMTTSTQVSEEHGVGTAQAFSLDQNYPNPFNPNSEIRYQISEFRYVRLVVYDLLGREVAVLVNEWKAAGTYSVAFDASGLASGIYFYRMQAGDFVGTRKMAIVK
jgi:hypothetical protein